MIKHLIPLMWLFLLPGLQSCGNEEEHFQRVDLETTGVTLKVKNNVSSLYGEISPSENELTFVATGNNAKSGFLTEFTYGNEFYTPNIIGYDNPNHEIAASGEWGHIEMVKSAPYTTKVVISKNTSSADREFRLTFGGGYIVSWVTIIQKAATADTSKDVE